MHPYSSRPSLVSRDPRLLAGCHTVDLHPSGSSFESPLLGPVWSHLPATYLVGQETLSTPPPKLFLCPPLGDQEGLCLSEPHFTVHSRVIGEHKALMTLNLLGLGWNSTWPSPGKITEAH